ncbi:MAG: right-handed parallel beta-helix repeat-containing protein, partial [Candidatus Woesearchaeota archaeon]
MEKIGKKTKNIKLVLIIIFIIASIISMKPKFNNYQISGFSVLKIKEQNKITKHNITNLIENNKNANAQNTLHQLANEEDTKKTEQKKENNKNETLQKIKKEDFIFEFDNSSINYLEDISYDNNILSVKTKNNFRAKIKIKNKQSGIFISRAPVYYREDEGKSWEYLEDASFEDGFWVFDVNHFTDYTVGESQQFDTLTECLINTSRAYDRCIINQENYYEIINNTYIFYNNSIGANANNITIDCNGSQWISSQPATSWFVSSLQDKLTLKNCKAEGYSSGAYISGTNIFFDNLLFTNTGDYGIYSYNLENITIKNLEINGKIALYSVTNTLIDNTTILECNGQNPTIEASDPTRNIIINNSKIGANSYGHGIHLLSSNPDIVIENSEINDTVEGAKIKIINTTIRSDASTLVNIIPTPSHNVIRNSFFDCENSEYNAIEFTDLNNLTIENNIIENCAYAVYTKNSYSESSAVYIKNNNLSNNKGGMYLDSFYDTYYFEVLNNDFGELQPQSLISAYYTTNSPRSYNEQNYDYGSGVFYLWFSPSVGYQQITEDNSELNEIFDGEENLSICLMNLFYGTYYLTTFGRMSEFSDPQNYSDWCAEASYVCECDYFRDNFILANGNGNDYSVLEDTNLSIVIGYTQPHTIEYSKPIYYNLYANAPSLIQNNTFFSGIELPYEIYISKSNFSINNLLSNTLKSGGGNNLCFGGEGNFYKQGLLIPYGDCGILNITHPVEGDYNKTLEINWTKQSSILNVTYNIFYKNIYDNLINKLGNTTQLSYFWDIADFNGTFNLLIIPVVYYKGEEINGTVVHSENFNIHVDNEKVCLNLSICEYDDITTALIKENNSDNTIELVEDNCEYVINGTYVFYYPKAEAIILFSGVNKTLDCNNSTFVGNGETKIGIYLPQAQNISFANCILNNISTAIQIRAASGIKIYNVTSNNSKNTFSLLSSLNNIFENFNLYNGETAIKISIGSEGAVPFNNTFKNFIIQNFSNVAVEIGSTIYNDIPSSTFIDNFTISSSYIGIKSYAMVNNTILNTKIENSSFGFMLESSSPYSEHSISNNVFDNLSLFNIANAGFIIGEELNSSFNNNTISNSVFINNTKGAIFLNATKTNLIYNNTITKNIFKDTHQNFFDISIINASNNYIFLNHFLSRGIKESGGYNNYCFNEEGNFYEETIPSSSTGPNDCGISNITEPKQEVYSDAINITWKKQSSFAEVNYDIFLEKIGDNKKSFIANTSELFYYWNSTTVEDGLYRIIIVPWIIGSRYNATNVYSENFTIDNSINITDCGDLNIPGRVYVLKNDLYSESTCLNILANNITVEGNGYKINYSTSGVIGYGINITNSNFTTIKNLHIVEGNISTTNKHAIYLSGASNSII